jgi:RecA-family ATPase
MSGRIKPVLIAIDPLAEVFDGDEIKRNLVKKFVGLLRPIIADRRTALVIAYHPSLTGLANRTGSSGSTGWRAAYRGNIWIEKDLDEDPTIDTGKRTLHVMKVTEGTPNRKINLRFSEGGVLVREDEPGGERTHKHQGWRRGDCSRGTRVPRLRC